MTDYAEPVVLMQGLQRVLQAALREKRYDDALKALHQIMHEGARVAAWINTHRPR